MKIKEFQEILKEKKVDIALLYNSDSMKSDANMEYFSGYSGLGALLIPVNSKPLLLVPKMELLKARRSMVKNVYAMDKKRFFESIKELIKKKGIKAKKVGIDKKSVSLLHYKYFKNEFKKIKTKDISLDCLKLREIKTGGEVKILKKSCIYADKILKKLINNLKDFKTESEAAAFLEHETKKLGMDVSFPPIVASGTNAAMPHHTPENVKLKEGFCVIDFGVRYKNYCSDITRTAYLGKIEKKEKEIYNFLLDIQKNLVEDIRINNNCGKIYQNCVKALKNYSKYFTHGLGHGVGIEIHELPNLTLNSKDRIKNNMIFTIEPGIYIPNKLGIRIEDTVLMKNKAIVLTKVPKELIVV